MPAAAVLPESGGADSVSLPSQQQYLVQTLRFHKLSHNFPPCAPREFRDGTSRYTVATLFFRKLGYPFPTQVPPFFQANDPFSSTAVANAFPDISETYSASSGYEALHVNQETQSATYVNGENEYEQEYDSYSPESEYRHQASEHRSGPYSAKFPLEFRRLNYPFPSYPPLSGTSASKGTQLCL
jgi:hypothetical protein